MLAAPAGNDLVLISWTALASFQVPKPGTVQPDTEQPVWKRLANSSCLLQVHLKIFVVLCVCLSATMVT